MCCITSTPTGSTRCGRSTPAGGRRSSTPSNARQSSRSRWPGRSTTVCRSRPGACRSWPTIWWRRRWSKTSLTRGSGSCCVTRVSPFQAVKTWKTSTDPNYEAKKNRVLELYAIADGKRPPGEGDPGVVICMDEFGPLNLQPHPGRQWAPIAVGKGDTARPRRRRRRATYKRPHGVRHLLAGYDLICRPRLSSGRGEVALDGFERYLAVSGFGGDGDRACRSTRGHSDMRGLVTAGRAVRRELCRGSRRRAWPRFRGRS